MNLQFSEAQLEDFFLCSCRDRLALKPIQRQVRLECGIIDVLCVADTGRFFIVELKAGPLKPEHLAQVLSYACELRAKHPDKVFQPMLIGTDVQDRHLANCLTWYVPGARTALCDYRIFDIALDSGITFDRYSPVQRDSECARGEAFDEALERLWRYKRLKDWMDEAIY